MTELFAYLDESLWAFTIFSVVLGLLIGSFLNVVVYRLPIMMERGWRMQCQEYLGNSKSPEKIEEPFNLVVPRSCCPHCGHVISALENIPVISYLWLHGRCAECGKPISLRYPLVELSTALLSGITAWHF